MERKAMEMNQPQSLQPSASYQLNGEKKVQTPEATVRAAAETGGNAADSHGARLQHLERKLATAEARWAGCEKNVMEMGSQLEGKLAALGSLIEENCLLQRRLENLENLLKNRNFWILRFPPGSNGEIPKVPVTFNDTSVSFSEEEWRNLEEWQKEMYKHVMRSNYEMLVSLDDAIAKPTLLSQIEQSDDPSVKDPEDLEEGDMPVDPSCSASSSIVVNAASWGGDDDDDDDDDDKEEVNLFATQEDCRETTLLEVSSPELQILHHDVGSQVKQEPEEMHIKEEPLSPGSPSSESFISVCIKQEEEEQNVEDQQYLVSFEHNRLLQAAEEEDDQALGSSLTSCESAVLQNATGDPGQHETDDKGCLAQCSMCNGNLNQETLGDHQYSRKRKFQCTECNRSFAFQGQLSQHLLVHVPGMQFHCNECNLCFSSQKTLMVHKRVHAIDWPLHCSACNRSFTDADAFEQHQQSHAPGQVRRCLECNVYFTCPVALAEHKRMHSEDWPFRCAQCNRTFVHEGLLMEHLQNHSRTRSRRCHICGSWLSFRGAPENSGGYCKKCDISCQDQSKLPVILVEEGNNPPRKMRRPLLLPKGKTPLWKGMAPRPLALKDLPVPVLFDLSGSQAFQKSPAE